MPVLLHSRAIFRSLVSSHCSGAGVMISFRVQWMGLMSTASAVGSFEHTFELSEDDGEAVLALIRCDQNAGRLRPFEKVGVTDEQALERFAIACSALVQITPQLEADGVGRRAVARSHLIALSKHVDSLRSALEGVQSAIGSDTYDNMPEGAVAALNLIRSGSSNSRPTGPIPSFADLISDPLGWQQAMTFMAVAESWASSVEPTLQQAIGTFNQPGKSQGSAPRIAGREILNLLRYLDRDMEQEVRRPRRKHLERWLVLLFEITKIPPPKLDVLAKHVLGDVFGSNPHAWTHPELPWLQTPREVLSCSIGPDGIRIWSGALADQIGHCLEADEGFLSAKPSDK